MGGSADAGVMTRSCEAQSAPSATNALVIAIFASRRRDDGLDWAGAPGRELYRSALPSARLCLYALRVSRQSLSTLSSDFSHQFRVVVSYLHENWACVCQRTHLMIALSSWSSCFGGSEREGERDHSSASTVGGSTGSTYSLALILEVEVFG